MSRLQDELEQCLRSSNTNEAGAVGIEFSYPASFLGFQGHFPNDPILPGVCILQSMRIGLEKAMQRQLRLTEVVNAKFIVPVRPGDTLLYTARESASENSEITVKTKVTRVPGSERVAELTLKFQPAE